MGIIIALHFVTGNDGNYVFYPLPWYMASSPYLIIDTINITNFIVIVKIILAIKKCNFFLCMLKPTLFKVWTREASVITRFLDGSENEEAFFHTLWVRTLNSGCTHTIFLWLLMGYLDMFWANGPLAHFCPTLHQSKKNLFFQEKAHSGALFTSPDQWSNGAV